MRAGARVVVVVNKWDAVTTARGDMDKPPADSRVYEEQVRRVLKFLDYAPVIFVSALNGKNVKRVFETVERVARERWRRITTGEMNRFLKTVDFERASVPARNKVKIYYMTQAAVAPPTFILFTDKDVKLHFSYQRFLENQVREAFTFEGTPIWFKVSPRKRKDVCAEREERAVADGDEEQKRGPTGSRFFVRRESVLCLRDETSNEIDCWLKCLWDGADI